MFYKTLTGIITGLVISLCNWLLLQNTMTVLHFNAPRLAVLIFINILVGIGMTWLYTATKDFLPRTHVIKELLMSLGLFVVYIPMLLFLFAFGSITFESLLQILIGFMLSFVPAALILSFFV
jgi:hypothetical protein